MKNNSVRYEVFISFSSIGRQVNPVTGWFKTLREARQYKSIVDDTVNEAWIFDHVKHEKTEVWK